jgi:hypothetical protein
MRVLIGLLTAAALVVLVVSTTPDGAPADSTVGFIPEPVTTEVVSSRELRVVASLPNGTEFLVTVSPPMADDWIESTGSIVMDIEGAPTTVGDVSFRNEPNAEYSYEEGRYRIPAAGYLVEVAFGEHVLRALGPDAEEVIRSSIRGSSEFGFPVLQVDEPFRWGSDDQSPTEMSIRFSTFEVRRGCSDLAVVCSPEGDLQVIWRVPEVVSAPPHVFPEVRIFKLVP